MRLFHSLLAIASVFAVAQLHATFSDEEMASSYSIKDVDKPPAPIKQDAPVLPKDLTNASGMVHVAFIIGEDGKVTGVRVVRSTSDELVPVVLQAVEKWMFEAAVKEGKPVAIRAVVPVRVNS